MKKIFLLSAAFLFLFSVPAHAQSGSLSVLEKVQEINLAPGGAGHFSVQLKNESDKNILAEPVIKSFKFNSDNEAVLIDDSDNLLVNSWLKPLNDGGVELRAGREKKVSFLITVPVNAENKGYYAAVYFIYKNTEEPAEEFFSENSLLLLGVESPDNNTLLREGQIKNFTVPEKVYYGPVHFTADFKNEGKIHYMTQGEIEIYNSFNRKSAVIPIESKNILPGNTVELKAEWGRKYLFGRYLAVAKIIDGDGNQSVLTAKFSAVPWKEVSAALGVLVLLYIARKIRVKQLPFE